MSTPTEKDVFASPVALTITLASLASSTGGVGRVSNAVDNTSTEFLAIQVASKIKLGTSPSAGLILFYLIRTETTNSLSDDAIGQSDAGATVVASVLIAASPTKASPSTGDTVQNTFVFYDPGPNWSIVVVQNTGVALDSTGTNHKITYQGVNPTFPSI